MIKQDDEDDGGEDITFGSSNEHIEEVHEAIGCLHPRRWGIVKLSNGFDKSSWNNVIVLEWVLL